MLLSAFILGVFLTFFLLYLRTGGKQWRKKSCSSEARKGRICRVFQPFCINLRTGWLHSQVILRRGVEELALDIPNNVVLELKVEEEDKQGKTKRTVEIEWTDGDESGGAVTLG
jgi:hypothetical protein